MNKSNTILILVVAVLGLAILVWALGDDHSTPTTEIIPTPVSEDNSINVSDQGATDSITINSVNLLESGYIVIHEDAAGSPGNVIGNSDLLSANNHVGVVVTLNRGASSNETFWAMLHSDDGNGQYEFPDNDGPIRGRSGTVVMTSFVVNLEGDTATSDSATIIFTDEGYSPADVTISVGGTVTWTNESSAATWPASAMHPTHTVYPGSNITKCGTEDSGAIFDACRGIAPGDSYSFTFNEAGEWGYHDHLAPRAWGKIMVTE